MQVIRETVNAPGCVTSVFHPPPPQWYGLVGGRGGGGGLACADGAVGRPSVKDQDRPQTLCKP